MKQEGKSFQTRQDAIVDSKQCRDYSCTSGDATMWGMIIAEYCTVQPDNTIRMESVHVLMITGRINNDVKNLYVENATLLTGGPGVQNGAARTFPMKTPGA